MSTQEIRQNVTSEVPSLEENPVERRRLLNILAQRRYRRRKQAKFKELEQQAEALNKHDLDSSSSSSAVICQSYCPVTTTLQAAGIPSFAYETSTGTNENIDENDFILAGRGWDGSTAVTMTEVDYSDLNLNHQQDMQAEHVVGLASTPLNEAMLDEPMNNNNNNAANTITTSLPDGSGSNSQLQQMSARHDFDDYAISIPGLSVLRAHVELLRHMYGANHGIDMFDPFTVSPFCFGRHDNNMVTDPDLPLHYKPTPLQKAIEHHPVVDCLPWVTFRDRFLYIMSLPKEMRPKVARNDMPAVILELIFAIKDAGGGLRVWASNPFIPENWEIGQTFYKKFWWAIDGEIVRHSNQIRAKRGESALRFDLLDTL